MSSIPDMFNIYDAKTKLSQLVARAEKGERVTISRHGRPVAQLVPYAAERADRVPGAWAGRVSIHPDFDEFTPADDADWYGQ